MSTFQRAMRLLATISGRREYTDPGEKFEHIAMMLFQPVMFEGAAPQVRLFDAVSREELTEEAYILRLRSIYNYRNPHALIGEAAVEDDE